MLKSFAVSPCGKRFSSLKTLLKTALTDENGNYIDEFEYTKDTIAAGVLDGTMKTETITLPTDEATAKAFIKKARQTFMNFSFPALERNITARISPPSSFKVK